MTMKKTTFTQTAFGPMHHLRHPTLGIDMPVALETKKHELLLSRHLNPERTVDGYLIYVLPGGGRWREPPLMTESAPAAVFGSMAAALA